jgi:uncharacterized protein (DUF433 family)
MAKEIVCTVDICNGKPRFNETRLAIEYPLGLLASGYTIEQVIEEYPELTREDIQSAIAFSIRAIQHYREIPA